MFLTQAVAEKAAFLRQGLVAGGGYLREVHVGVLEGDDVSGAGDADPDLVVLVPDLAVGENVEQLGVERTPVDVKGQIIHRRAHERGSHDTRLVSSGKALASASGRTISLIIGVVRGHLNVSSSAK
jgi:hypothetical protein